MSQRQAEQTELVRGYLEGLPLDELVSMTISLAEDDRAVWTSLVGCARVAGGAVDTRELKKELTAVLRANGYVDWRRSREYAARAEAAIGVIRTALAAGHAAAVVELTEHAVARLDTAMNHIDDSGGYLGLICDDVQELHRLACIASSRIRPSLVAVCARSA